MLGLNMNLDQMQKDLAEFLDYMKKWMDAQLLLLDSIDKRLANIEVKLDALHDSSSGGDHINVLDAE